MPCENPQLGGGQNLFQLVKVEFACFPLRVQHIDCVLRLGCKFVNASFAPEQKSKVACVHVAVDGVARRSPSHMQVFGCKCFLVCYEMDVFHGYPRAVALFHVGCRTQFDVLSGFERSRRKAQSVPVKVEHIDGAFGADSFRVDPGVQFRRYVHEIILGIEMQGSFRVFQLCVKSDS